MKKLMPTGFTLAGLTLASLVMAPATVAPAAQAAGKQATVRGWVIDSACYFVKDLEKPISSACALKCAAGGSPLVILGDDRLIYWPIDGAMPARGQNSRLVKFAGQKVRVAGKLYERGASRAMVIDTIAALPPERDSGKAPARPAEKAPAGDSGKTAE